MVVSSLKKLSSRNNRIRNDQVDLAGLALLEHAVEAVALLRGGPADPLVREDAGEAVFGVALDIVGVEGALGLIAEVLFLLLRAHPAVGARVQLSVGRLAPQGLRFRRDLRHGLLQEGCRLHGPHPFL